MAVQDDSGITIMPIISMEVNDLVSALSAGANRDLGTVLLVPEMVITSENTPPSLPDSVPAVMTSFSLVPSGSYKFRYKETRFLKLYYLLERNSAWEFGELMILNQASATADDAITPVSEPTQPVVPPDPTAPTLTIMKNVLMWSSDLGDSGSLGVDLSAMQDPVTINKDMMFGIAFKTTTATPAVFPVLRAAIALELPVVVPPTP
jgi:hypothetical protein